MSKKWNNRPCLQHAKGRRVTVWAVEASLYHCQRQIVGRFANCPLLFLTLFAILPLVKILGACCLLV